ncbi:hypothetical protein C4K24_3492 [Pseudomonas chlororaphis subsp. aurantiaca]|nr:hypothetical protein C4K24_3492 [Pseudomonas chlororaphis subsp. aurantiaca]
MGQYRVARGRCIQGGFIHGKGALVMAAKSATGSPRPRTPLDGNETTAPARGRG